MDVSFPYQKKRSEFGRQCLFSDKGPDLIDNYPSNKRIYREYILKDPVHRSTQLAPIYAEHTLNTMRAEFKNSGANHMEGGWPKDVNCLDEEQTKRYRRKIEKEDNFFPTMMQLFKSMDSCILQNNAINIYQEYFSNVISTPLIEKCSARTVNVYQDQNNPARPINHISWSPDNQTKFAVSHCNLMFQQYIPKQATASYVWEVENPNRPLYTLKTDQQIVCLEFNLKDPNFLASGQMNGQLAFWDLRKGMEPIDMTLRENSFLDPVQSVLWIHSKTNSEFFSASTDGMVKWWDTRKLSEPTDTLILDYARDKDQCLSNALGASSLEYETTIPTRFMVGTEEGVLIMGNRKGKSAIEKMALRVPGAHLGPIVTIQRNPQFLKNFLTIGDWSAKLWSEDCRESAIMWTPYYKAGLTDGAWSPTRLSCFFTTRTDGTLDVWDILQQQKVPSLSVKICDERLTSIKTHDSGRLLAVANQIGTVYLVELSKNLSTSAKNDKMLLTAMLERESRREKLLEARAREIKLKQKADKAAQAEEAEEEQQALQAPPATEEDAGEEEAAAVAPTTAPALPPPPSRPPEEEEFMDAFVRQYEKEFYKKLADEIKRSKGKKVIQEVESKESKESKESDEKGSDEDDEDDEEDEDEDEEGDEEGEADGEDEDNTSDKLELKEG